jgi:hypothetical protein
MLAIGLVAEGGTTLVGTWTECPRQLGQTGELRPKVIPSIGADRGAAVVEDSIRISVGHLDQDYVPVSV